MSVPLLDLKQQHAALAMQLHQALDAAIETGRFILGPEVDQLEAELATYINVRHAIAMSSGSDALLAALMAIGLTPGDEVITTTFSFFATAGCITRLGGRPVFVDVDPDTLNLDPEAVARAVTPRTRAIIAVHLYGLPADLDRLRAIAKTSELTLIEDACQAIGAEYGGRQVGAIGDMAAFSFFPSKNLGCLGDGGLLTTENTELAGRVRSLRVHGSRKKYHHEFVGGNFRLDALQAAFLRIKLPYLDHWTRARQSRAERYRDLFVKAELNQVKLPPEGSQGARVYHQFVIRTPQRDELREWLTARAIGTEVYYPTPLHLQPCFSNLGYREGDFPVAERASKEVLALPMYPELEPADQETVVEAIRGFYEPSRREVTKAAG